MRIVLYEPEIPQNTCGIIRTCACAGMSIDLIYPMGFILDLENPTSEIKRIIMDYKCEIKTHASWKSFLETAKNNRIILFSPHSELSINEIKFQETDYLVFGKESIGVGSDVFESCHLVGSIPMKSNARSLNLMASVSIVVGYVKGCV